jgi:hypothetical protein
MSSPAKRRRERLARQRRLYQNQAADRAADRERAYQSWQEERRRMGFGIDIVTATPEGLRDVTPNRRALAHADPQ